VSYDSRRRLPAEMGSCAAMCPAALDLASRLRWTPTLPRVLWLRTSPPSRGGLQHCHMSNGSGPRLRPEVGSGTAMCPAAPFRLWASSIKKRLADLPMQLGTHVPNTRAHVSKVPDVRAIMGLQDMPAGSVVNACKARRQATTVQCQQYGQLT
jgi:hypothetical protein